MPRRTERRTSRRSDPARRARRHAPTTVRARRTSSVRRLGRCPARARPATARPPSPSPGRRRWLAAGVARSASRGSSQRKRETNAPQAAAATSAVAHPSPAITPSRKPAATRCCRTCIRCANRQCRGPGLALWLAAFGGPEDARLGSAQEGGRVFARGPYVGFEERKEGCRVGGGVEVEIHDDVVRIIDRLLHRVSAYACVLARARHAVEGRAPGAV